MCLHFKRNALKAFVDQLEPVWILLQIKRFPDTAISITSTSHGRTIPSQMLSCAWVWAFTAAASWWDASAVP